jgi:hypothetical protein
VRDRLVGLLLFLPVPVVLALFTQLPLGVDASLGLGVLLMLSHRVYARPWALDRAGRRCLWCGGPAVSPGPIPLAEPLGETDWAACRSGHSSQARRFVGWAGRHRGLLSAGILGGLAVFLVLALLSGHGLAGPVQPADAVNLFRFMVATSVLPLGWLGPGSPEPPPGRLAVPFPVHIQALVGSLAVAWLFRMVGLAWLALALRHVAVRLSS